MSEMCAQNSELAPVCFDRTMRIYRMQAPEVEYPSVCNLVELLFRAKMHTHETVRDFLRNVFAQKVMTVSQVHSGWTEYDCLMLGNLSPRCMQEIVFEQIHNVVLNDNRDRTLLWVARTTQEFLQTLQTAINTAATVGFQVLSTRIAHAVIVSPQYKTLDEAILRAAGNVVDTFFTLREPRPISQEEQMQRSSSLYIDASYANTMHDLFASNFVRLTYQQSWWYNPFSFSYDVDRFDVTGNSWSEDESIRIVAKPNDDYAHCGFTLNVREWREYKFAIAMWFIKHDFDKLELCEMILSYVKNGNGRYFVM